MYRNGRCARALAGGVALAVMMHTAAHAQEAPAAAANDPQTDTPGLGEIVVTAQKRSENIQDTPIAITAVTSDRIDQGNLNQQQKLQFSVPSMSYAATAGFTRLSLRGIGTDTSALSEVSVATYQDGVYTGMLIGQTVPSFDLERIEVLRGPQGTLYGRNTTGGVINYITKEPSFDWGVAGDISYGNYDAVEGNVGLTGPLVEDKIAIRASFHYGDHDGYYRNIAINKREYAARDIGGRLSLLVNPTENLKLIVRADKSHSKSSEAYAAISTTGLDGLTSDTSPLGIFSQPAAFFQAVPGLLSPSDIAKLNGGSIADYYGLMQGGPALTNSVKDGTIVNGQPTIYKTDTSGVSLTANWDIGSVAVKSISAYRFGKLFNIGDTAGVSYPLLSVVPTLIRQKQYTQEFNISGKAFDNRLDWFVGAFLYHEDGYSSTNVYLPSFDQTLRASYYLANPPGSAYAFNLNPATLPSLNDLPGVFPSIWQTALYNGPGYPGDAAGATTTAGVTIPATASFAQLQTQKSDSYAVFAQATYDITDRLRLTGGFRYTIDKKDSHRIIHSNFGWALTANGIYQGVQAGVLPPEAYTEASIASAAGLCDTNTKKNWKAPTGMIGIDYDAGDRTLTYAKVSWGYKAGGMNGTECNSVYDPEYLTSYEAGVKTVVADGQILANLATYYYDYKDIQFVTYIANSARILNAGSAKIFGVELEYAIRPDFAPGLQLDGSVSYQDSKYGAGCFADPANLNNAAFLSDPQQACPATVINPNTGQAVPIGASADIKGNQLIRAPRWKANVGLQYSTDVADFGNLLARVDAAWSARTYNDVLNSKTPGLEGLTQRGYWMLNALVGWTSPDKRYAIEAFGDNLTNSGYYNGRIAFNTPPTMLTVTGQLAAPRTYGVRIRAKFGPGSR